MKESLKTISVSSDVYDAIQHLKGLFAEMTENEDVTEEDVIATLVSGFAESMEQNNQWWCCGWSCSKEWCGEHCNCV